MGDPANGGFAKFADDGFSRGLADMLEERVHRMQQQIDQNKAVPRDDLARFVWGTAKATRKAIEPEKGAQRAQAWQNAKGMMKEMVDFNRFNPNQYSDRDELRCVEFVLEKKVVEIIDRYRNYVMTGEIKTVHPPPKLLGETDLIICVDKPCHFLCSYGNNAGGPGGEGKAPQLSKWGGATSASALLNGPKAEIQLHEYLALKYQFETAVGTREWWKTGEAVVPCSCGKCELCSCTQTGCCNRLDKETSGVMICAKTKSGFGEVRKQFQSEHSVEKGGTEKYYLALVHGNVQLPKAENAVNDHWNHRPELDRGRIEVSCVWNTATGRSEAYQPNPANERKDEYYGKAGDDGKSSCGSHQWAVTFYRPVAWFKNKKSGEPMTLLHLQIITGRRHQIRFHCAEIGYPLIGDSKYHAPYEDREWAKRMFLHSYQTKFREPFTDRWFEATSPLSPDLSALLDANLDLEKVVAPTEHFTLPLQSRRDHTSLHSVLKQYDPAKPLLVTHDLPRAVKEQLALHEAQQQELQQQQAAANVAWQPVPQPQQQHQGSETGDGWQQQGGQGGGWGQSWQSGGGGGGGGGWRQGGGGGGGWGGGDAWQGGNAWQEAPATAPAAATATGVPETKKRTAAAVPLSERTAAAGAAEDDDDDDWGGWTATPAAGSGAAAAADGGTPSPEKMQRVGGGGPSESPAAPAQQQHLLQPTPIPPVAAKLLSAQPSTPQPAHQPAQPAPQWTRRESRSTPGVYYYWDVATGTTQAEPPSPWEKRQSRSAAGVFYYWNTQTGATSVIKPEV